VKAEKEDAAAHSMGQVSRTELLELLNEDLSGEYQAIISYDVYSKVLKGAEHMNIAGELEKHAAEELSHALITSKQIDYLGAMPAVQPKAVRRSEKAKEMPQFDLETGMSTMGRYRDRARQCEGLGEYAMAEHVREILKDEQDHLISMASALGEDVPAVSKALGAQAGK
jgi:bacterioferritin